MRFRLKSPREGRKNVLSHASRSAVELLERRQLLSASFGPAQQIGKTSDLNFPTTAVAGDFDGDGDLDITANSTNTRVVWYPNLDHGHFGAVKTITMDVGAGAPGPGSLATGDLNGDKRSDVVAVCYEYPWEDAYAKSKVAWYEYQPQQNQWREHVVTIGRIGGLQPAVIADLDRDGDNDIIAANYRFEESIRVVWFENSSAGTQWKPHTITDNAEIATGSRALAVGDFDGDGWLDVVAGARFSGTVVTYRNPRNPQRAGGNWTHTVLDTQMNEMTGVSVGDFNKDGALDVVAVTDNPYDEGYSSRCRVSWYQNDAGHPGKFSSAKIVAPVGGLQRPWSVEATDLDLDGDADLLVGCVNQVAWYENPGTGKFGPPRNIGTTVDAWSRAYDLNGDARPDVLSAVAPANQVVWYPATKPGSISGVVFKDHDQDGKRDAGEAGLKGRTVFLDLDNNRKKDGGEPSAVTDGSGRYTFGNLVAGNYNIRQVLPDNWAQSTPKNSNGYKVRLNAGQRYTGVLHGSFPTLGSIRGRVFHDLDQDGRFDSNEAPLKGRTLFVDLDNDKKLDASEPSAVTSDGGWYTIRNLSTGDYNIRQILPAGWIQTTPRNGYGTKVHLLSGQNRGGLRHGANLTSGRLTGPFVKGSGSYTRVANGGFESGLNDWYEINTDRGVFSTVASPALVGARSASASPFLFDGQAGFALGQIIKVMAGETYVLSGWVNTSANGGGSAYLDLGDASFEPGGGPSGVLAEMDQSRTQFVYAAFTVPADVREIEVRVVRDGYAGPVTPGVHTWFDDIAVTRAAQFKPPTRA